MRETNPYEAPRTDSLVKRHRGKADWTHWLSILGVSAIVLSLFLSIITVVPSDRWMQNTIVASLLAFGGGCFIVAMWLGRGKVDDTANE